MNVQLSRRVASSVVAASVAGWLLSPPCRADSVAPTTAPARPAADIVQSIRQSEMQLSKYLADPTVFSDKAKRDEAAGKAVPLLKHLGEDFDAYGVAQPAAAAQLVSAEAEMLEYRAALGDATAASEIDAQAKGASVATALRGQLSQDKVRWLQAGPDAAGQAKVVDDFEPLAKAHPESVPMTVAAVEWAKSAASPELSDRLLDFASTSMSNQATSMVANAKQQIASARKLKAMEGKPMVVSGTTPDGKAFSSADYKGKVVLVDFWATWCGPCVAGLPEVKDTYAKYHDAGLEVIGVSNDYAAEKLTAFTKDQQMPWVQLFDAQAAASHSWNPITLGYGINGIPHMFVIDRDGNLVSSDARATFPKLIADAVAQHS